MGNQDDWVSVKFTEKTYYYYDSEGRPISMVEREIEPKAPNNSLLKDFFESNPIGVWLSNNKKRFLGRDGG